MYPYFLYHNLVRFIELSSLTVLVDREIHRISLMLNVARYEIGNLRICALLWFALLSLAKNRLGDISLRLTNNN